MKRRDLRRLAMQTLYQLDLRGEKDAEAIRAGLVDALPEEDEEIPEQATGEVWDLALPAWKNREDADGRVRQLAPDWPTHRQPPLDRAILRLAFHEMATGHAPVAVAIHEAVELAKAYCAENSPAFVNGVLDKLARQLEAEGKLPAPGTGETDPGKPAKPVHPEAWLRDALEP